MAPTNEPEEVQYDDITIGLQMQQFFDEWHYRVLHSGLAYELERSDCIMKALDMFNMHGIPLSEEEKAYLADMDDEGAMVKFIVSKMSMPVRKTFEHFALQLQLVVSTATRVRHALEEGVPEEVARVMEDCESGIGQQVLRQAVLQACKEVGVSQGLKDSWSKNMESRIGRLNRCANDAVNAQQQLEALSTQLDNFSGDQNDKAKSVLMRMSAGTDKALLQSVMRAWMADFLRAKMEADIHKKFRKQIEDAEVRLMQYRQEKVDTVRSVIMRRAQGRDRELVTRCIVHWQKDVARSKEDKELTEQNQQLQEKLANLHQSQQENTKKVLTRLTAGNETALLTLCFQAMVTSFQQYKSNREFEDKVRATEDALKDYMEKKSEEAMKVMSRMLAATDSGIIYNAMTAWGEMYREDKKRRIAEEMIGGADGKFAKLKDQQKKAAKGVMNRANDREAENLLSQVFAAWHTESKSERIVRHYTGKMDAKKHQLQAVQSMFQNFAVQLEQGMASPRTTRKGGGHGSRS